MDPITLFFVALAVLVVSFVIQSLLVKTQKVKPASLEDWDFPQWEEGTPEPVVFGDGWITGPTIMWYGNYRTKKIKAGGKK